MCNKLCAPALLNLSKSPAISCLWGTISFGREQSLLNKQDITRCGFVGIYREARVALKQWLRCVCVGELLQVSGRREIQEVQFKLQLCKYEGFLCTKTLRNGF